MRLGAKGGLSARTLILALVALIVLPGIAFTSLIIYRYAQAEVSRTHAEARTVARAAATAIDARIGGITTMLQTLTASAHLSAGDMQRFYEQVKAVEIFSGIDIALRTPDGNVLVHSRLPYGTSQKYSLPVDAVVLDTKRPAVSDVYIGPIARRPLFAVVVPVMEGNSVKYLLHSGVETDQVAHIISTVPSPAWLIGVGDRHGTYVARSERHSEFSGKPGVAAYLEEAKGAEGWFEGESALGDQVLVGYVRSSLTGWLIAANIPKAVIEAPLREALVSLIGFGFVALGATSLLAVWLARFVSRPLEAMAAASRVVGHPEEFQKIETPLRDIAEVRNALASAAEQVRDSNTLLESRVAQRTAELERTNVELIAQMSARENAESQLRQMQKMEAIGQLTGGIAHDFNNMLSIVISSLEMLQRRLQRGEADFQKYIDAASEGARRAAALTSRLLAFSRQQPLAPAVLDANKIVSGMSELLQRTLGETIRIETVLAGGLWKTFADSAQVENAIVNLAVNARDAMPEGGRLTIETGNVFLDEAYAARHDTTPGQYVMLAITDTGTGMPQAVIDKAFDPFFTTKEVGLGTGLGLSQVFGFVKQSSGHIKIYSEVGQGTTIKIYLPRYYGNEEERAETVVVAPLAASEGQECILVVEDDEGVRALAVEALQELGYVVLEAAAAPEALALVDRHPEIALLLTDVVMPDTNGRKLAEEALRRRPGLKILYMTGFTRNAVVHNGMLDPGVNMLAKPFTLDQLASKVHAVLKA